MFGKEFIADLDPFVLCPHCVDGALQLRYGESCRCIVLGNDLPQAFVLLPRLDNLPPQDFELFISLFRNLWSDLPEELRLRIVLWCEIIRKVVGPIGSLLNIDQIAVVLSMLKEGVTADKTRTGATV